MLPKERLIPADNGVLERECRDGSERANRLGRKLGAFRKDLVVHLCELRLIPDPEERCRDNQGHRGAERHDGELPAKVEGNCQAADDVQDRNDDKGHVRPQELLELARIGGQLRCEGPDGVVVGIEEGYRLGENVAEVLSTVVVGDVLPWLANGARQDTCNSQRQWWRTPNPMQNS